MSGDLQHELPQGQPSSVQPRAGQQPHHSRQGAQDQPRPPGLSREVANKPDHRQSGATSAGVPHPLDRVRWPDQSKTDWLRQSPPFLTSGIVHTILILVLALLTITLPKQPSTHVLTGEMDDLSENDLIDESMELADMIEIAVDPELTDTLSEDAVWETLLDESDLTDIEAETLEVEPAPSSMQFDLAAIDSLASEEIVDYDDSSLRGKQIGAMLRRRNPQSRMRTALRSGGSGQSEAAVNRALDWFARHQFPDGSWSFGHDACPQCAGQCANPGINTSTAGATGMALLCFLGAGETHQRGKYKKVVEQGITHLLDIQEPDGSLAGGKVFTGGGRGTRGNNSYCHGFALLALTEAYGLTRDRRLVKPSQAGIEWTVRLQDPKGGGFRYTPGMPGDMSVTGLQIMALKSAKLAYLNVPEQTMRGALHFLDHCAGRYGAKYGYDSPKHKIPEGSGQHGGAVGIPCTTAIGLLCRMYTGWPRNHPGLSQGMAYLMSVGPSKKDMFYNYYASLALYHYGGPQWQEWNKLVRDGLVAAQINGGHESGSWAPFGAWAEPGGRLMDTAFACMTLEVYYRYMPIYRVDVDDDRLNENELSAVPDTKE